MPKAKTPKRITVRPKTKRTIIKPSPLPAVAEVPSTEKLTPEQLERLEPQKITVHTPALFFGIMLLVVLVFVGAATVGAFYFISQDRGDRSASPLRNITLSQPTASERLRDQMTPECASVTTEFACEAREDCAPVTSCECETEKAIQERCGELVSDENCVCDQSVFVSCRQLVCAPAATPYR